MYKATHATLATHAPATPHRRRRRKDRVMQPVAASSRWANAAERIGWNGEWAFDLADSVPYLLTALPCWQHGGLVLYVTKDGCTLPYGQSEHSVGEIHIEVRRAHYYAWVNGEAVSVPADGNCFFHAVWRALQACTDESAVRRIFQQTMPASGQDAVNYFRREIRQYTLGHPELEPILLGGDDDENEAWAAALRAGVSLACAAFSAFSAFFADPDDGDADAFFDAQDTVDLPAPPVQRCDPASAPGATGSANANRQCASSENLHRGAPSVGPTTTEGGFLYRPFGLATATVQRIYHAALTSRAYQQGEEFIQALRAADVLEALSPILMPDVFVDASADAHWMPQTEQDEWLPEISPATARAATGVVSAAFLAESQTTRFSAGSGIRRWVDEELQRFAEWGLANISLGWMIADEEPLDFAKPQSATVQAIAETPKRRTPSRVRWSPALVEYRAIPRDCQTEFQRVLFLAGSQISGAIAYKPLLGFAYWGLAVISRRLSAGVANLLSLYGLITASKQGDVWGQAMPLLLALPYEQLSPHSPLFASLFVAVEEAKRYIDETLEGVMPDCISSQLDSIYITTSIAALVAYFGYFANRKSVGYSADGRKDLPNGFIVKNNTKRLRTPLGRAIVEKAGYLLYPGQAYAVLRAIVDAKPIASLVPLAHPVCPTDDDPHAARLKLTFAERATQRREKHARLDEMRGDRARRIADASAQRRGAEWEEPPALSAAATATAPAMDMTSSPAAAASETTPFVTSVAAATGIAAVFQQDISRALAAVGGLMTGRRIGVAAVATVASSVVVYAIAEVRLDWLAEHPEHHRTPAPPFLSEQALAQVEPVKNGISRWISHPWNQFHLLTTLIEREFDNGLFEKVMSDIWLKKTTTTSTYIESVYANAARLGLLDYEHDKSGSPATTVSSEIRYGGKLARLLESPPAENSEQLKNEIIYFLIKIKSYETSLWRDSFDQPGKGKVSSVARLESLFSIPCCSAHRRMPSENESREYLRLQLRGSETAEISEECKKGHSLASNLLKTLLHIDAGENRQTYRQDDILEAARNATATIDAQIADCELFLYNFRGSSDQSVQSDLSRKSDELIQYQYASIYLPLLIIYSQGFIDILLNLKTLVPAASSPDRQITVLNSRASAVREAFLRFTPETDKLKIRDFTIEEWLDYYPALIASNQDVFYFISIAEVIFFALSTGYRLEDLYREAIDPSKLIQSFRRGTEGISISPQSHRNALEGVNYLQMLQDRTLPGAGIYVYEDFDHHFKDFLFNDIIKLISLNKLTELGLHPYDIAAARPQRCIGMALAIDTLVIPAEPVGAVIQEYLGGWVNWHVSGRLDFCQFNSGDWIFISTIGEKLYLRKISDLLMRGNPALALIRQGIPNRKFASRVQKGHLEWRHKQLKEKVFIPLFGENFPLDETGYRDSEIKILFGHNPYTHQSDGQCRTLLEIARHYSSDIIKKAVENSSRSKKSWWQEITPMLPIFDKCSDPSHALLPPAITWNIIEAELFLSTMAVPAPDPLFGTTSTLRASVSANACQGFGGVALVSRVLSEGGYTIPLASLNATAEALTVQILPWEQPPLALIEDAMYKNVRRLMNGKFVFRLYPVDTLKPNRVSDPVDASLGASIARTFPQIIRSGISDNNQFYEIVYHQESVSPAEKPDRRHQEKPSEVAGSFIWDGDPATLTGIGTLVLPAEPFNRAISTVFSFSRSDLQFSSPAVISSASLVRDAGFHKLQFGSASNIVPALFDGEIPFSVDRSKSGKSTEILVIPSGDQGTIGIRINFSDIARGRPLLVSPGPLSSSTFMMAVSEQQNAVVFYHFSKPASNITGYGLHDPVIRSLFEVHNEIFKNSDLDLSVPSDVSLKDLHILASRFDYVNVAFSDVAEEMGLGRTASNVSISRETSIHSTSHHSVSAGKLQFFNYGLLDSDLKFSKSEGNCFYALSGEQPDRIEITGRTEIIGMLDDEFMPLADNSAPPGESGTVTKEITEIMQANLEYIRFTKAPSTLTPAKVKEFANIFESKGYKTGFRIVKIWPSSKRETARIHFLLLVHKNDYSYPVDIAATQFSDRGIKSPIFASDHQWRALFQKQLHNDACVMRDFSDYSFFNSVFESGAGRTAYDDVADKLWTELNLPAWMLTASRNMLVDAISVNFSVTHSAIAPTFDSYTSGELVPQAGINQFSAHWLNAITDENFNSIIHGPGNIDTAAKIEYFLNSRDINTVIYVTLTYQNITDQNPAMAVAVGFQDNNKRKYVIDPDVRAAATKTALFAWTDWLDHRSQKIHISGIYRHTDTVKNRLSLANTKDFQMLTGRFFEKSDFQIFSFGSSDIVDLSNLIGNITSELTELTAGYTGLDIRVERKKLENIRYQTVTGVDGPTLQQKIELHEQQQTVTQLQRYLVLNGLWDRVRNFASKIDRLHLQQVTPPLPAYTDNYMAGSQPDVSNRLARPYPFINEQFIIKTYDILKRQYIPGTQFEFINVGNDQYSITREQVVLALQNYQKRFREIKILALAYALDGGGRRALDIAEKAEVGAEVADRFERYCSSSSTAIFAVVDNAEKHLPDASVFGISVVQTELGGVNQTVEVSPAIAHPFSQIREDHEFTRYVLLHHRHSDAWSKPELRKYMLEGVEGYLDYETFKYLASNMKDVKKIITHINDPHKANIASISGFKKIDSFVFYSDFIGPQYRANAQIYISELTQRRTTQVSSSSPTTAVPTASPTTKDLLSGRIIGAPGKGPIYLNADRTERNLPWLFLFARSDSQRNDQAGQSSRTLGSADTHSIQLGRGADIVSYPGPESISFGSFWGEKAVELGQLDVLQMANGNYGANGIEISLDELKTNRPLLVSSGALLNCIFIIGIKSAERKLYIYLSGKSSNGNAWRTDSDGVKSIANVHNTMADSDSQLTLSPDPTIGDLHGLFKIFDSCYIVAPTPMTAGSSTRVDRTDENHWVYNYNGKNNEFSIGNSQLLIFRSNENELDIQGFMETGSISDFSSGNIQISKYAAAERYFPQSATPVPTATAQVISELQTALEVDPSLKALHDSPDAAAIATRVMASLAQAGRRWLKIRLVLIWSQPDSFEPQMLHLVIDNTNEIPFAFDVTAKRQARFESPFYGTEDAWARKLKRTYPRSFVVYQDFDSVTDISKAFSGALSVEDTVIHSMTALNVPKWRALESTRSVYSYTSNNVTMIQKKIVLEKAAVPAPVEMKLDPAWKTSMSLRGLKYHNEDGIFNGVYEKPGTFRREPRYYIEDNKLLFEVTLDSSRTGWSLKIPGPKHKPAEYVSVWKNSEGHWVTSKPASAPGVPSGPIGGNFPPRLVTLTRLTSGLTKIECSRVVWSDDYDVRMADRDALNIRLQIDADVSEKGGLAAYIDLTGTNPYQKLEPVAERCANNIFKLMVENGVAVNPTKLQKTDYSRFSTVLASLDHQKSYVFLVTDERLSHTYLIDVPAGPETKAYIVQSNLGDGMMPELKIGDWIMRRGGVSVSVSDILALMHPGFVRQRAEEIQRLLALIFDVEGNPGNINLSRLREDRGASFIMESYDQRVFENNVDRILSCR